MGGDSVPQVIGATPGLTETSPLLGSTDGIAASAGGDTTKIYEEAAKLTSGPVAGSASADGAVADSDVRGGMPEVAAKLHVLGPAVAIGIFLCALDQLLVVATYAKIGSDLKALNNTSWIATA